MNIAVSNGIFDMGLSYSTVWYLVAEPISPCAAIMKMMHRPHNATHMFPGHIDTVTAVN